MELSIVGSLYALNTEPAGLHSPTNVFAHFEPLDEHGNDDRQISIEALREADAVVLEIQASRLLGL